MPPSIILERMMARYHLKDRKQLFTVIPHLIEFLNWYRPHRATANRYWFESYHLTQFPPTNNQIRQMFTMLSVAQVQALYHCYFRHQNRDYLRQLEAHMKYIGKTIGPNRFRWLLEDFRKWCYSKCVNFKKMY